MLAPCSPRAVAAFFAPGPSATAATSSPRSRAFVRSSSALGAAPSGQRYHQIVSLPDAVVIGKAVRIPVRRDDQVLESCWSADEKSVVYHDILFSSLSIVEAAL